MKSRLLLLLSLTAGSIPLGIIPGSPAACAAGGAAVVIGFSPSDERAICIEIQNGAITGLEALRLTGLPLQVRDFGGDLGAAVCKIDGLGNEPSDCPGSDGHWHYWQLLGSDWRESQLGASRSEVSAGDIEGWTWAMGTLGDPPVTDSPFEHCENVGPVTSAPLGWKSTANTSFYGGVVILLSALSLLVRKHQGGAPR